LLQYELREYFVTSTPMEAKESKTINLIFLHSRLITHYQGFVSSIVVELYDLPQLNPEPLSAAWKTGT
jgi:hypothetical protein